MHGRIAGWALVLGFVGLCSGCGTSGRLEPTAAVNKPDDAYFVIGVHGGVATVEGRTGEAFVAVSDAVVENGQADFEVSLSNGLVPFLEHTEYGYVVGKAHRGGDKLAIWEVDRYSPCGSSNIIVFTAPAGKVVYITDIDMHATPGAGYVNVSYRKDIEAARAFLKAHYPNLADTLEMGSYETMPCRGGDPFDIQ